MKIVTSRFLLLLNVFFISHQINATHFDLVTKIKKHKFKIAACIITGIGLCCSLRYLNDVAFQAHLNDFKKIVAKEAIDVSKAKKAIKSLINCSQSWFCSSSNLKKFKKMQKSSEYSSYFPQN